METTYNTIGINYNLTRQADPYLTSRLLYFLAPGPGKHFLDIGCGTGNYTIALSNHGAIFTGVDPSAKMLGAARNRNNNINWLVGTAGQIPAKDHAFDGVIATLTIHHWTNLDESFKEIFRVSKPCGTLVIFTASPEQMKGYWLNYYFPGMLKTSIIQMPAFEFIESALSSAGFKVKTTEKYFVKNDLRDHFLYSGKHRPEIYFNEEIRRGISSFAALANADEVNQGLLQLQKDLENGVFERIKREFENDLGDYLLIAAEK